MAKDIIIQEDGVNQSFSNVKKIQLNNVDSGSSFWIPDEETQLAKITITSNGTYVAEDDGYYGYSEVTVNGAGKAIGTDPDDGNEYEVYPDDNGHITKNILPSSIAFTVRPTKVIYNDGEDINLAGATVRGYLKDGTPWAGDERHSNGYISLAELTLDPAKASWEDSQREGGATSDLNTNWEQPIPLYDEVYIIYRRSGLPDSGNHFCPADGAIMLCEYCGGRGAHIIFARKNVGELGYRYKIDKSTIEASYDTSSMNVGTFTINNEIVYYLRSGVEPYNFNYNEYTGGVPDRWTNSADRADYNTIWTAVYGDKIIAGLQEIQTKWSRVGDGKELKTPFEIQVNKVAGGSTTHESDSGQEHGGCDLGGF